MDTVLTKLVRVVADDINQLNASEVSEYIEDTLDIEVRASLSGEYRSALIAVSLGEPSIYIDTDDGCVHGY